MHTNILKILEECTSSECSRYERQLARIRHGGRRDTISIEAAVNGATQNLESNVKSFVIYGEPQSGKTEMMICLTAKLLDTNHKTIVLLLNDSVDLLDQNLTRFQRSSLDPAPVNFSELKDPISRHNSTPLVVFCKKNARDLEKLLNILSNRDKRVIIDDEADFASPNSKINKNSVSPINNSITKLLDTNGIYVGVTATPARLDLNNSFNNDSTQWVHFPPHRNYRGQETFFPDSKEETDSFRLTKIPDSADDPKYLRQALLSFMVSVSDYNLSKGKDGAEEQNFCFLVHTSGKKADHTIDYKIIRKTLAAIQDRSEPDFTKYYTEIHEICKKRHPGREEGIVQWIFARRSRAHIVVMNSDSDKSNSDFQKATNPAFLFTIAIGGNIVSRGVTFDNLLGMFFTRDVKHRIQQDTYIQRARMFGNRGDYLQHFELTVPNSLYEEWRRCFILHRLSLKSIECGLGTPLWLESGRISLASDASIDRVNVSITQGEMGFAIFKYGSLFDDLENFSGTPIERLKFIQRQSGQEGCPNYLIELIDNLSLDSYTYIHFLNPTNISSNKDGDIENIRRANGGVIRGFTRAEREVKFSKVEHIFKFSFNDSGMCRLYYKYVGSLRQVRNIKHARI